MSALFLVDEESEVNQNEFFVVQATLLLHDYFVLLYAERLIPKKQAGRVFN